MTNTEMLRATNNEDLIMDTRKAIDILNDVIRELYGVTQETPRAKILEQGDKLDEVRQFVGRDL